MVAEIRRGAESLDGSRKPEIFLSHSSYDKDFVRELTQHLNRFGVDAWFDEWELAAGDPLHGTIAKAMARCKYVGVVISPQFLQSKWCADELNAALARGRILGEKAVLPLMLSNAMLPTFVADLLYIDFSKNYFDGLTRLSALLHGATPKQIGIALANNSPSNLEDVFPLLLALGWGNKQLLDSEAYEDMKFYLKDLGVDVTTNEFVFDHDLIKKIRQTRTSSAYNLMSILGWK
jgi:hypothetical protein